MLQPKPQYFPTAEANFERCMVTLEIIQNERLIELKGQKGAFFFHALPELLSYPL